MEENQDPKNPSKRVLSSTELDQVETDHTLATVLQEQEEAAFGTIESEGESEIASEEFSSNDNDYAYFEFESELEFLEGQGSNDEEDMEEDEEDDVDLDDLTYEELIALGEIIGVERRGLSPKEISLCLRPLKFVPSGESKSEVDRCVVCQVEYDEGEMLSGLGCKHLYHSECISKWLQMKRICPICSAEVSCIDSLS